MTGFGLPPLSIEGEPIALDPGASSDVDAQEQNIELYISLSDAVSILEGRPSDDLLGFIRDEVERITR